MKTYAGIGSRNTPQHIMDLMTRVATKLEKNGYTLNSGGADGADKAFENGVDTAKQIFIPWKGFNGIQNGIANASAEAMRIAENIHPAWNRCSQGARKLHARNIQQILGESLDNPVKFVICWTEDGKIIGGTATAIKLAMSKGIEVINLGTARGLERVTKYVNEK